MWAGYLFDDIDNKRFLYHLKTAVITSSLLALCIYLMGPKLLVKWNLLEYTEQARGFFGLVTRGLPATFYNFFGGITLFRLAAGIMNPIATATLVIFTINILFSSEIVDGIKNVSFVYWILILTTVLTFSRGPILGAVLAIPVGLMFWRNKIDSSIWKKIFWIFFLLIVVGIIGIGVFQNMFESSIKMQDSSSKGHYYALLQSWEYLQNNWMGSGIGSSGQWAESDVGAAVENSYAMIIGQVGSIAFFFLAGAYFLIIRNCLRRKDHFLSLGLFLTFIMMLINAFFSPSLMSVTPLTLFWFLVGYFETSTPEIIEAHS
jgi:MFS family permease